MRVVTLAALFVALVSVPRVARATPTAQLHLTRTRGEGTDTCPDEAALRSAVRAQLGYDPFVDGAPIDVTASIERRGNLFVGRVVASRPGQPHGSRDLTASDCPHLAEAMALTISIAIDPMVVARPPPLVPAATPPPTPASSAASPAPATATATAAPVPPPQPPAPEAPAPSPNASASSRLALGANLTVLGSAGVAPSPSLGLDVGVSLRGGRFSIGVEARADLPASAHISTGGDLSTSLLAGLLVPCAHAGVIAVCAVGGAGSMRGASTGVTNPRSDYGAIALVGARFALELPITKGFLLRPELDGLAAVARPSLRFNDQVVWTVPLLSGTLGLGAVGRF